MSIFKRLAIATLVAATAVPLAAHAGTFTTLYHFTGANDGGYPSLIYHDGKLFGTTPGNVTEYPGTVFSICNYWRI